MNPAGQTDAARRGPERFSAPAATAEKSSPVAVLGAVLALAALVVGVPVGLWLWQGPPPVPTGLPSRDDLTQPLTVDALIVVLLVVVWLAWLQFTVCVVVEAVSLLRGGGLPRPVPLSGRSQALARALVGTVLVGASLIGSAGTASADDGGRHVQRDATVAVHDAARNTSDGPGRPMQQGAPEQYAAPAIYTETTQELRDVADQLLGRKVVVVKPPEGRYHHNLWDIAEEHLGDGRRWKEIFELNKGRPQPDGGELVIGRLIQPGWVLVLPDDAVGADRVDRAHQQQDDRDGGGDQQTAPFVDHSGGGVDAVESSYDGLAGDLVGGGLLAASLAAALAAERRRRRGANVAASEIEAEVAMLVGADTDRAERVDRALRRLAVSARADGVPLPPVYAVTVDDDEIELRIAPAAPSPPAPWIALKEGRRWRLDRESAEADQGPLGSAPYPGLVCIGRDDDGADVLIDLEAVGGPASVSGADAVAREVVSALAVQLVTSPWSDDQVVHSFELSPVLARVSDRSFSVVDDLPTLVGAFEVDRPDRNGQDVLSGRVGRKPDLTPQYLMLGAVPDDELVERLQPMIRTGDRGLGVVAVGKLPGTRWHLTVDESGHLALPLLDIAVTAVRLTERTAVQLAGLFAKAREQRSPATESGVLIPRAPRPGDDAQWASAAVRVGVLGPLETRVPGQMDEVRLALATEVATFLALQTAPVHPSVLAASVWPRGVTSEVRDATIARVREWLGNAADGSYLLRENDEGRLFLADEVAVDWHAFCTLVQRSRGAAVKTEMELLRRALQLVRGPFLDRRDRGRYTWLARTRLDSTVADAVEATAHRLVELSTDDPGGAAGAARAGLRMVPHSQLLWRDLLRAEYDGPGGPAIAAASQEMVVALAERGAELEAETEALVEELLPGARPAAAGTLAG
ncbi:BTAD domain-containing putative transcriptional regulator [Nocardioides antri]|uniref:Bacterial transcriptional activator domain-containing protein n=1 Tax=Nocardioides antri TaxID=2607659 RepID=A0A5B1M4Y6_9ACTN|nr:BTAD domain-containing putative transcriptional regulator [Nocardioides antri]KAA1427199.1 hypothetical protein F0U47_06755 [Nocardioides antri]